jgi:hypothetical protein
VTARGRKISELEHLVSDSAWELWRDCEILRNIASKKTFGRWL